MKYIGLYSDPQDIATKANVDAVGDRVTAAESDIDALEAAVAGKQATITGGATTIVSNNLTASRALVSDANGKVAVSAVTSDELGYIDGVTSNVQTQLNAKVPNTRKVNNKALSADITLTASDVGALPSTTAIPSKTSDLTNDSGFITSASVPEYTVVKSEDSGNYAAIYYLTKGGVNTGAAINIPKDLFVESGSIVENPTGYPEGKYLKLVLQNQADPIYINVADLVDAYTAGNGVSISDNNVVSANVVAGNGLSLTTSGITMSVASTSANGAMSSSDKTKLNGIESGAQKNAITSVNSKTGAVVLTQDDVGDGTTYVRTQNDFTDDLKTQIGTNKSNISSLTTTVSGKQATITGAATTITSNNLTASRALVSNSSGKVAVSDVTATELGYLDGVTSNIQTQLNSKLSSAPVTSVNSKTGAVTLGASDVGAVPTTRTVNGHALSANITVTKDDIGLGNVANVAALPLAGGTMTGSINMGGLKITNVATPLNATDAANKAYADSQKGVKAVLAATQPTSQVSGDIWFKTSNYGGRIMVSSGFATKGYIDNLRRTEFIASIQAPKNVPVGTVWYALPSAPYTFSQVDALGYTFANVDALGITWAEFDKGGW